jgi:hypothetical protein
MPRSAGCAHCGEPATTVILEIGNRQLEIDLCDEHLERLLRGSRPATRDRALRVAGERWS